MQAQTMRWAWHYHLDGRPTALQILWQTVVWVSTQQHRTYVAVAPASQQAYRSD